MDDHASASALGANPKRVYPATQSDLAGALQAALKGLHRHPIAGAQLQLKTSLQCRLIHRSAKGLLR